VAVRASIGLRLGIGVGCRIAMRDWPLGTWSSDLLILVSSSTVSEATDASIPIGRSQLIERVCVERKPHTWSQASYSSEEEF